MKHHHLAGMYEYSDGCPICFRNECADLFLTNLDWFVQMVTDELTAYRLTKAINEC